MAQFKKSARSIAFNPVTLPDAASEYLRAENDRIENLKETYDAEIQNRDQYADALERKNEVEKRNLDTNEQLKAKFDESYDRHLRKRYDQLSKKEDNKTRAHENRLKFMSVHSKKALDLLNTYGKKRKKEQQNIGFNLYNETGVNPVQLKEFQEKLAELKAEGISEESYIASLEAKNVDVAALRRIQGLSGWRLVGAQKAMALKAGADWQAFTSNPDNREKKYELEDGTMMSLQDVFDDPEPNQELFRAVLQQMQFEFTEPYSDLSPEFATEYFWPNVNQVNITLQQEFTTRDQERFRTARAADDANAIKNQLLESTVGNLDLSDLHAQLGGGRVGWERIHAGVNTLIETGQFGHDELDALENGFLLKDGKKVFYKEHFSIGKRKQGSQLHIAFLHQARKRIDQNKVAADTLVARQNEANAKQAEEQLRLHIREKGVSPRQYQKFESVFYNNYGRFPSPELRTYATNETYGTAEAEAILTEKWLEQSLTMKDLEVRGFSSLTPDRRKYWEKLAGHYGEKANVDQINAYVNDLKTTIKGIYKGKEQNEINIAHFRLQKDFKELAQINIASNHFSSPEEAVRKAYETIETRLQAGIAEKPTGVYKLNTLPTGHQDLKNFGFGFLQSDVNAHKPTRNLVLNFEQQYSQNKNIVTTKRLFGELNDKQSLIYRINTDYRHDGIIPEAIKDIAVHDLDRTFLQIINSQIELYEGEGVKKIEPSRDQQVEFATDAEFSRFITNLPSVGRTTRALVNTNYKKGLIGIPAYSPILDLIASRESSNDTRYRGYDSFNTGGSHGGHESYGIATGTDKFQKPLMEMTVQEIMDLQYDPGRSVMSDSEWVASGKIHAAGRYQIVGKTLANVVRQVGLDPKTTLFNEETQDLLAIHLLWRRVGKQLRTDGDALVGLGQEWVGLQNVSAQKKIEALERTKSDPRFKNFDPVRLYPQLLDK